MKPVLMLLFIVSTAALCITSAAPARMAVAVNDLTGQGVSISDAAIITDRLRAEMINTGAFNVMERSEMQSILKEQGFKKSGACDDRSCAVEVGQLLGVDRMVAGTVGRIGSIYTITLRMINVSTGEILFTVSQDCECTVENLLVTAVAKSALRLAGGAGKDAALLSLKGKTGDVHFVTALPGATVILDNDTLSGVTPLLIKGIPVGEHNIIAMQGSYKGALSFTLNPDDLLNINIPMSKGRGALKLFSSPSGAQVIIDGVPVGFTPIKVDSLAAGEHAVKLQLKNHRTKSMGMVVQIDKISIMEIVLDPTAYLQVRATPAFARVMVNGILFDAGPDTVMEVAPGKVVVSVSAAGYEAKEDTVVLAAGVKTVCSVKLVSKYGVLKITSVPTGADVFLNGLPVGKTRYGNDTLQPGRYAVMVCKEDHDTATDTVAVVRGEITEKTYSLEYRLCSLYVSVNPAGAKVSVDTGVSSPAPLSMERLIAGVHTLHIENHFCIPVDTTVTLRKHERSILSFNLKRSQAYFDSIQTAKVRFGKTIQRTRQITFGVAGLAAFGYGIFINAQGQALVDEQNALADQYQAASSGFETYKVDHEKYDQDIDRTFLYRNILYSVGGVLLAACGVSFVF